MLNGRKHTRYWDWDSSNTEMGESQTSIYVIGLCVMHFYRCRRFISLKVHSKIAPNIDVSLVTSVIIRNLSRSSSYVDSGPSSGNITWDVPLLWEQFDHRWQHINSPVNDYTASLFKHFCLDLTFSVMVSWEGFLGRFLVILLLPEQTWFQKGLKLAEYLYRICQ